MPSKLPIYVSDLDLGVTLNTLLDKALKPNTQRTYNHAQNRYLNFCTLYNIEPCPATEESLLYYIAYLFKDNLKGSSIRVYLAAIRSLHVNAGIPYISNTPRILMALKGANVLSSPPSRKDPITFDILCRMLELLSSRADKVMLESSMSLAFFGCMRAGEICLPDNAIFDAKIHLCVEDVTLQDDKSFVILLKSSKTDQFSNGVKIFVGCSGHKVCAYCSMNKLLRLRSSSPGSAPLFADLQGNILRRNYFVSTTKLLVSMLGLPSDRFSGHSFRAGSATSGADAGFDNWEIKMLGRWNSEIYNIYLRNPKVVSSFARRLVNQV